MKKIYYFWFTKDQKFFNGGGEGSSMMLWDIIYEFVWIHIIWNEKEKETYNVCVGVERISRLPLPGCQVYSLA